MTQRRTFTYRPETVTYCGSGVCEPSTSDSPRSTSSQRFLQRKRKNEKQTKRKRKAEPMAFRFLFFAFFLLFFSFVLPSDRELSIDVRRSTPQTQFFFACHFCPSFSILKRCIAFVLCYFCLNSDSLIFSSTVELL